MAHRLAVGAYVIVIALMAAQAIGRAAVLRDRTAMCVAIGAAFFMLSDSLLATNKFAMPLPRAQFWVLATYYVAQIVIAANAKSVALEDGSRVEPGMTAQGSEKSSPALFGGVTPR